MKVTNFYSRVERITYTFDECDIRKALMSHFNIDPKTAAVNFDIVNMSNYDEDERYEARLELSFETPQQTINKRAEQCHI